MNLFFFSSRRRHTRCLSDWSSDVCSSDLMRHRQMLIEYGAAHVQHMQKALTQMNLQLQHVISDITGSTGMKIIRAIVAGERDRRRLAAFRDLRTKANEETIARALEGDYRAEHLFALKQSLELFDMYQKQIAT